MKQTMPRRISVVIASGLALLAAILLFCVATAHWHKGAGMTPRVRLVAYINISSGCQQATVDLLQALAAKYPDVALELVDFGDGGAGAARWEQSGLKCMAIEINGASIVKYPVGKRMKIVAFRAPAGLYWEHSDLEAAVAAAREGHLQPATEEEFLQANEIEVPLAQQSLSLPSPSASPSPKAR